MKFLLLAMLVTTVSCSHHHKEKEHHHHEEKVTKDANDEFEKKCAHSIMEGDTHVDGKEEFKITHSGHNYYFSTKEKMDDFSKNMGENVKKATKSWRRGRDR